MSYSCPGYALGDFTVNAHTDQFPLETADGVQRCRSCTRRYVDGYAGPYLASQMIADQRVRAAGQLRWELDNLDAVEGS